MGLEANSPEVQSLRMIDREVNRPLMPIDAPGGSVSIGFPSSYSTRDQTNRISTCFTWRTRGRGREEGDGRWRDGNVSPSPPSQLPVAPPAISHIFLTLNKEIAADAVMRPGHGAPCLMDRTQRQPKKIVSHLSGVNAKSKGTNFFYLWALSCHYFVPFLPLFYANSVVEKLLCDFQSWSSQLLAWTVVELKILKKVTSEPLLS